MMTAFLSQTLYLGANAKVQAIRFALCLALGLIAGVVALLYLRKARPTERALTDFFATVSIGALFVVCIEFFLDGKFELYGLASFVVGALPIPLITKKLLARKSRSSSDEKPSDTETNTNDNNDSKSADSDSHKNTVVYNGKNDDGSDAYSNDRANDSDGKTNDIFDSKF